MKKIAILGSTGSIGTQTLEVIRENKDIEVTGLAAGTNVDLLEKQIRAGVAGDGELRRDQQLCALGRRLPRGLQDLFRVIPAVRQTQLRRHGRNLNKSILHGKQLLSGPAPAWPGAFWFLL